MGSENTEEQLSILDRLSEASLEEFPEIFRDNLEQIYEHEAQEIQNFLCNVNAANDTERCALLHSTALLLYNLLCEKFPAYVNRETLRRRKSEKIAFDIYIVGFALASDLEDTRLKTITKPTSRVNASQYEESFFNETNGELLETCLEFKQTMSVLTAEVKSYE